MPARRHAAEVRRLRPVERHEQRNIDKPKNGFDVILHTEDKTKGQRWFDQLSEGGKAVMPFGEPFWSAGFGSLVDRFGVPWMVNTIPSADWKPPQG